MSLQNAIDIAEANLRDAKLDWEDFCREKDELEEPVDENDTEVTVQHSVMEALIMAAKAEAARQEGARGGEPVAWRILDQFGTALALSALKPGELIVGETLQPLYASPAEPSGWRPIESAPRDAEVIIYTPALEFYPAAIAVSSYYQQGGCFTIDGHGVFPTHWMPLPLPPTSEGGGA
jgi:hypothetical protein